MEAVFNQFVSTHHVPEMYASRKVQVFLVFAGQKHISVLGRATNEQVFQQY